MEAVREQLNWKEPEGQDDPSVRMHDCIVHWAKQLAAQVPAQLEKGIKDFGDPGPWKYLTYAGIQIHVDKGEDWIWHHEDGGFSEGSLVKPDTQ